MCLQDKSRTEQQKIVELETLQGKAADLKSNIKFLGETSRDHLKALDEKIPERCFWKPQEKLVSKNMCFGILWKIFA